MLSVDHQLKNIWEDTLTIIKDKLKQKLGNSALSIFSVYYLDSTLYELNDQAAVITVSNNFQKIILQQDKDLIEESLAQVIDKNVLCNIYYAKELEPLTRLDNTSLPLATIEDNLLKQFTFDSFVVGPSNKETYTAALTCANQPGKYFNPVFIFGNSGLGKTHLLHAIGNEIKIKHDHLRILYLSSLDFIEKMVEALNNRTIDEFKDNLNSLDVFLVDDIQFIAGKEKTHEVFFQIFNNLVNSNKQVVITCDRLPAEIKGLESRLVSRFNSGLSVGITSPEFETAIAILKKKIELQAVDLEILDNSVLEYLATNFSSDIRSLEGAVNRLIFYAITFNIEKIDINIALEAFKNHTLPNKEITIGLIKKRVADFYGFKVAQLASPNRSKNLVIARHIAMYLCRKHLDLSFFAIGKEFGNRDHSTVLNATDKIEKLLRTDLNYQIAITEIENSFPK